MVGKTAATRSQSPGAPDPSKMTDNPRGPNTSPSEPKVPTGPRLIDRAGAMLEKSPPKDRPTVEKVPRRPKPAPGGGHSKDEPQEGAGSKSNKDSPDRGKGGLFSEKGGAGLGEKSKGPSPDRRESKFKDPSMREKHPSKDDMPRRP